ncbi:putative RNA-directed DNA polymerase [Tanacetum coccineum]
MTPGLITSNQELLLANTSKEATWLWQEAQEKLDFALSTLTQQTQGLTTDCHAGNPSSRNSHEPKYFKQAAQDARWREAMQKEVKALEKNGTWTLEYLPEGKRAIDSKWVYKIKFKPNGEVEKYKARLVAKGFNQMEGVDYHDTFAPVAKLVTVRTLLAIAVKRDWIIHQLDVNNAFLHGDLDEEVYMKIPQGFSNDNETRVCRLRKSLYGLKQASRNWYHKFTTFLRSLNFRQSKADHSLFIYEAGSTMVVVLIYVDDVIITENNLIKIQETKKQLDDEFSIKDLSPLKYFLRIEVAKTRDGLVLSQQKYTLDILEDSGKLGCKPSAFPIEEGLKLDKGESESRVDATDPRNNHLEAVNHVLGYLKATPGQAEAEYKAMAFTVSEIIWVRWLLIGNLEGSLKFSIIDRLIENLKTIWIGRFHLSANLARFERPKASTFQNEKPVPSGNVTGFKQSIVQNQGGPKESYSSILKPSLVLDDSCLVNRDLTNAFGASSPISSINNLQGFEQSTCITPANDIPACNNQDIPEAESVRPPSRSARSNSRVFEEAENSVDRVSSESFSLDSMTWSPNLGILITLVLPHEFRGLYGQIPRPRGSREVVLIFTFLNVSIMIDLRIGISDLQMKILEQPCGVVELIKSMGRDVQTAFLPNRQILDGPFIINEILARCKLKKQQAMIFKVDFAKAYDSVSGIILMMLSFFGFCPKNGVHGFVEVCLLGRQFILVIGEFDAGIFNGYKIGTYTTLSHLFYADDAVFIGEWSHSNLKGIMNILRCFSLLSALHGLNGHVLSVAFNSTWSSIITEVNSLKVKGVDLIFHCKIRVGKENKDISVADKMNTSISSSFRRHVRGGVESQQLDQLSLLLDTVILSNMDDRMVFGTVWRWCFSSQGCSNLC